MNGSAFDYKYTLSFLQKINRLEVEGIPLANRFFLDGHNLSQAYQQLLFEDIKIFSGEKKYIPRRKSVFVLFKNFILGSLLIKFSLLSLIFARAFGKVVLVYSMDKTNSLYKGDFRLKTLYTFLSEERISYIEIFHTVLSKGSFVNLFLRRRMALYLEALDWVAAPLLWCGIIKDPFRGITQKLDFSTFETSEERAYAAYCVKRLSRRAATAPFKVKWLTRALSFSGVRAIFAIDDYRFYQELALSAQRAGIPYYALQHGHYTKYHVAFLGEGSFEGKLITPQHLLVWSEYWKKELLRLRTILSPEQIVIGGLATRISEGSVRRERKVPIVVLIPYETVSPKEEVSSYIKKMLLCPEVRVLFKLRPDVSLSLQMSEYGLTPPFPINLETTADTEEAFASCDIVAGVYSTFLYDGVTAGKAVVVLQTSSDYGEGMIENKIADRLGPDDICRSLGQLSLIRKEALQARQRALIGENPLFLKDMLISLGQELRLC